MRHSGNPDCRTCTDASMAVQNRRIRRRQGRARKPMGGRAALSASLPETQWRARHCPIWQAWHVWRPCRLPYVAAPRWCRLSKNWEAVRLPLLNSLARASRWCCPPEEQGEQMRRLSAELYAACQLSMALGCETSRCLAAVLASLKRQRLLNDLRRNAFAMPQATVKLLMALPLLTVLLGEGMGARPLAFLCGDARGLLCLGFALGCYAIGLLWIRVLLRENHP